MVAGPRTLWNDHALPRLADRALRGHDVGRLREQTCAGMSGRVLEIGFGSGLNVRFYPDEVTAVDAVEPADVAWGLSEHRRARSDVPVERTDLDGQRLRAADASYDVVLTTFTLCTIPDARAALGEVRRVLRPGGSVHFLEHGLAPESGVARWQRRLEPLQRRFAGGCHLTRQPTDLLEEAGFTVDAATEQYLPGPRSGAPWGWVTLGRASR
jgi:SAM-dependent methyltransferase